MFEVDVQTISEKSKATAVLSIQSDYEMAQRGIDEKVNANWYKKYGI